MKKFLKLTWDEFIYGGHFMALGLVSIVCVAAILLNVRITWDFVAFIYFFTLAACLFGRYVHLEKDALTNPERSQFLRKQAKIIPYIIGFLILSILILLTYFGKYYIIISGLVLVILSFLYDLHIKKLTKKIIGLKNFYVAALFSLPVVILILYYNISFSLSLLLVIIFVYLMVVVGTAFCDIKDIENDKKESLKTFAIVFGYDKIITFLVLITFFAASPIVIGVYLGLFSRYALMILFAVPYNLILFRLSREKDANLDFLTNVVCDAQLIFWLLFLSIGRVLFV